MPGPLVGQVALVTGAGRGLGRSIALALAKAGASVGLTGRTPDDLLDTAEQLPGGTSVVVPADVTKVDEVEDVVAEVESALGPIDLLVNNAGSMNALGPLVDADLDEWWRDVEVNLRGPAVCSAAVLPGMIRRRRGRIVMVASGMGGRPGPHTSAYAVSKAGVLRLTDSLAAEVGDYGVSVFAMSPGVVRTEMTDWPEELLELRPDLRIPDESWTPPERGARLIVRLATGRHDRLSGCFVHVNDNLDALTRNAAAVRRDDAQQLRISSWHRA